MTWYEYIQWFAIFMVTCGHWLIILVAELYMKKKKIGFYEPMRFDGDKPSDTE